MSSRGPITKGVGSGLHGAEITRIMFRSFCSEMKIERVNLNSRGSEIKVKGVYRFLGAKMSHQLLNRVADTTL